MNDEIGLGGNSIFFLCWVIIQTVFKQLVYRKYIFLFFIYAYLKKNKQIKKKNKKICVHYFNCEKIDKVMKIV